MSPSRLSRALSRCSLALVASAVLFHCESKPSAPSAEQAESSAQPAGAAKEKASRGDTAKSLEAASVPTQADEIPTEEDFEQEAETQITEASDLKGELDALEKEIGATPPQK